MARAVITEIRYPGLREGDAIAIRVPAGADTSDIRVAVYNGDGTLRTLNALEGEPVSDGPHDLHVIDAARSTSFNGVTLGDGVALLQGPDVARFVSLGEVPIVAAEPPLPLGLRAEAVSDAREGTMLRLQPDGAPSVVKPQVPVMEGPLFTPGTVIRCPDGGKRVETLMPGDLVCTAGNGNMAIRSVERHILGGADLAPHHQPVRIERSAFGGGFPRRDLTLSPHHRIAIRGARLALMTGRNDGVIPVAELVGQEGVRRLDRTEVHYVQVLLDAHEMIFANGWAAETSDPAASTTDPVPETVGLPAMAAGKSRF
ncbi:Hint domain-containing protein [Rhodobacteraceae bacterium NNCM2]|nr:Hint domain-containing protein [Coraliihabitans acroporae]